jgi:putative tryptophan/tyrosine transport system substrate-binding protein
MAKGTIVVLLIGLTLASVHLAEAQQPGKIARIGVLRPGSPPEFVIDAFRQRLRDLGYVEGKNIVFEYRYADGKLDRLPELAAELVRLKVDVIFTPNALVTKVAMQATSTIPIVFANAGDPVAYGIVASLARPGGNATGLTNITEELSGKRLELLIEALPTVSHVAALWFTSGAPTDKIPVDETLAASRPMKVRIQVLKVHEPEEFDGLFAIARKDGAKAMTVLRSPFFVLHSKTLVDLAIKYRLPAIYEPAGRFVELGGLMSCGANPLDMYRHVATFVDKILKGAKPADLPVEQPTKFEFVINLKTAKALNLTIPQSVLYRADKVIR